MKRALEMTFDIKPLSLNTMIGSRFVKNKFKKECFAQIKEFFDAAGIKYETVTLHTKKMNKIYSYPRVDHPIFDIVNISWLFMFKKRNRRDLKNFIGGVKWLEDCMVEARILTDDCMVKYKSEEYDMKSPAEMTGIKVKISEV